MNRTSQSMGKSLLEDGEVGEKKKGCLEGCCCLKCDVVFWSVLLLLFEV